MAQNDDDTPFVIEPGKRYLLARPCGGFNDCLVQLDRARRHAETFDRTLIIDTHRSGLQAGFETLFAPRETFGCPVAFWTPEIGKALDTVNSVQPEALVHRISTYQAAYDDATRLHRDTQSNALTSVDLKRDHPETLLVQERAGGGLDSLRLLRRLSLRADVASEIARRLLTLGADYDAVHIRHSDYRTDFNGFLQRVAPVFSARRLLICTDSAEVKKQAPRLLGDRVHVISIAEPPDTKGQPLHQTELADRHAANLDLLTEILAMVRARTFLFAQLDGTKRRGQFSGFAKLVVAMRAAPDTFDILFANCDPAVLRDLRAIKNAPARQEGLADTAARGVAKLKLRWWNRHAARQVRKIRSRVRKRLL